jgi:Fe-S-cluster containining protein
MQFSVLALEAAMVNERLGRMPPLLSSPLGSHCTLLEDSRCLIYHIRPIICRTQGLPLAYRDDESGPLEVSACYRNFPADFLFAEDHLVFMDQFNCRLAALNVQYCRAAGLDPLKRIPLADLGK